MVGRAGERGRPWLSGHGSSLWRTKAARITRKSDFDRVFARPRPARRRGCAARTIFCWSIRSLASGHSCHDSRANRRVVRRTDRRMRFGAPRPLLEGHTRSDGVGPLSTSGSEPDQRPAGCGGSTSTDGRGGQVDTTAAPQTRDSPCVAATPAFPSPRATLAGV